MIVNRPSGTLLVTAVQTKFCPHLFWKFQFFFFFRGRGGYLLLMSGRRENFYRNVGAHSFCQHKTSSTFLFFLGLWSNSNGPKRWNTLTPLKRYQISWTLSAETILSTDRYGETHISIHFLWRRALIYYLYWPKTLHKMIICIKCYLLTWGVVNFFVCSELYTPPSSFTGKCKSGCTLCEIPQNSNLYNFNIGIIEYVMLTYPPGRFLETWS